MHGIKKIFVPLPENGFLPHALGSHASIGYLVVALALLLAPAYLIRYEFATVTSLLDQDGDRLIGLVNDARAALGLTGLKTNPVLDEVANRKAMDMLQAQYFAHTSPVNKSPWDFLKESNYAYTAAGENLAIDFSSIGDAHVALMNSPSHRKNILSSLYTEVGVAVAQGYYQNRYTTVVVQYFGNPKKSVMPSPAATSVPASRPAPKTEPLPAPAQSPATAPAPVPATPVPTAGASHNPGASNASDAVRNWNLAARAIAIFFILGLAGVLLFNLASTRNLPLQPTVRALAIILIFGGIAWYGPTPTGTPRVTPTAFVLSTK